MDIPSFAQILDPQVSARGAKYALIDTNTHGDGKLRLKIGNKMLPSSSPFGISSFNNDDATRKILSLQFVPQTKSESMPFTSGQ